MAKFSGMIGFAEQVEQTPGVWVDQIVEKAYFGDLTRSTGRHQSAQQANDNITVSNEISIVADPYAQSNFHQIRYVLFMGVRWKVTSVEVQYPRLILSVGEVYNGPTA